MKPFNLRIQHLPTLGESRTPTRAYDDDAGFDLYTSEDVEIAPGTFADIPTGIAVELPAWSWGLVTGRSSALRKRGLLVHSGIIDTGYRGELYAGAFNLTREPVVVLKGERVAQLIIIDNASRKVDIEVVGPNESLSEHARGARGFGSSGA